MFVDAVARRGLRLVLMFVVSLLLTACDRGSGTSTPGAGATPPPNPVRSVTINQLPAAQRQAATGTVAQLTASALIDDGQAKATNSVDITNLDATVWKSSDLKIATVSSSSTPKGRVFCRAPGDVRITVTYQGVSSTIDFKCTAATIQAITVSPTTATAAAGLTQQYRAMGNLSDGNVQDVTASVIWSVDKSSLASISNVAGSEGLAKGLKAGDVTVSAKTDNSAVTPGSATFKVTAPELKSITISGPALVAGNETAQFTASLTLTTDAPTTCASGLIWKSSNTAVATVNSSGLVTGVTQGGPIQITATCGSIVSNQAPISVEPAFVFNRYEIKTTATLGSGNTLIRGQSVPFTVARVDSNTLRERPGTIASGATIVWSSSDATIATINPSGLLQTTSTTGLGTIQVDVSVNGTAAKTKFPITVVRGAITQLSISAARTSVPRGQTEQFSAQASYQDGSMLAVPPADLTWSVTTLSGTDVARIGNGATGAGLMTANNQGTARITATSTNGLTASQSVTVLPPVLVAIQVSGVQANEPIPIPYSYTTKLTAMGLFSDDSKRDISSEVTWVSFDPSIGTVSTTGLVTGIAPSPNTVGTVENAQVTIEARDPAGKVNSDSVLIEVRDQILTSITLFDEAKRSLALFNLPFNATEQFQAMGQFVLDDGAMTAGMQVDITNRVNWSLAFPHSNPAIARIGNGDANGPKGFLNTGNTAHDAMLTAQEIRVPAQSPPMPALVSVTVNLKILPVSVKRLTVSPGRATIPLNGFVKLKAQAEYTGTAVPARDVSDEVQWTTPSNAVSLNTVGLVTAKAGGTARVTATHPDNFSASAVITVINRAVDSILAVAVRTGSKDPIIMPAGYSEQLRATVFFIDGGQQDYTTFVVWTSAQTTLATVSNAAGSEGLLTASATAAGSKTTVKAEFGGIDSNTLSVDIRSAALSATNPLVVTIPGNTTMAPPNQIPAGFSQQAKAVANFQDAQLGSRDVTQSVEWQLQNSANKSFVDVTNFAGGRGRILARSTNNGNPVNATIVVTEAMGASANMGVQVTAAVLVNMTVSPQDAPLAEGLKREYIANGVFSDGSEIKINDNVSWTSLDTAVASVSDTVGSKGEVTATGSAGESTSIVATHADVGSRSAQVRITAPTP